MLELIVYTIETKYEVTDRDKCQKILKDIETNKFIDVGSILILVSDITKIEKKFVMNKKLVF